jgi:hypothetical protein
LLSVEKFDALANPYYDDYEANLRLKQGDGVLHWRSSSRAARVLAGCIDHTPIMSEQLVGLIKTFRVLQGCSRRSKHH